MILCLFVELPGVDYLPSLEETVVKQVQDLGLNVFNATEQLYCEDDITLEDVECTV